MTSSRVQSKHSSTASHHTPSSQDAHSRKTTANVSEGGKAEPVNVTTAATVSGSGSGKGGEGLGGVRSPVIVRTPQTRCEADQIVFKVQKGVRTFDLCTEKNVLVTGGMDRIVRIWNPYLPSRPIARLRGHNAPIFLVKIAVADNRLFSISTDKAVLVSVVLIISFRDNTFSYTRLLVKLSKLQKRKKHRNKL